MTRPSLNDLWALIGHHAKARKAERMFTASEEVNDDLLGIEMKVDLLRVLLLRIGDPDSKLWQPSCALNANGGSA